MGVPSEQSNIRTDQGDQISFLRAIQLVSHTNSRGGELKGERL